MFSVTLNQLQLNGQMSNVERAVSTCTHATLRRTTNTRVFKLSLQQTAIFVHSNHKIIGEIGWSTLVTKCL